MNFEKELSSLKRKILSLEKMVHPKKVEKIIKVAKKIGRTELYRKCFFINSRGLDSVLKTLVKEKKVKIFKEKGVTKDNEIIQWTD